MPALGFDIIEENENGKRSSSNTVFVMIHCDKFLYNNLLWKNWALVNLTEMILIGNSFGSMFERHPHRILKDHYKYIWLIHELAVYEENVVENWTERDNVFNDQAITVFPRKKCTTIDFPSIKNSGSPIYEKSCLFWYQCFNKSLKLFLCVLETHSAECVTVTSFLVRSLKDCYVHLRPR